MSERHSGTRSRSPDEDRNSSRPRKKRIFDVDPKRRAERERQEREREELRQGETDAPNQIDPLEEYKKLMEMKSGGVYVPPAKLRILQEQITANGSPQQHQRLAWDKLKKNINGSINKINTANIRDITVELFKYNIVRGRGILVRSLMKAQALSRSYTAVYASLIAIINSKIPQIGELLINRLILQFRRAFKRKDKAVCLSSSAFLAHLCNQQVGHEILCLQILHILLKDPTDDLVEVAVSFVREVGAYLADVSSAAFNGVFDRFTAVLHEGSLDKRTQYMIETLFQIRKDGFSSNPVIPEGLDLVEEDEQNTHLIGLDDEIKGEETLNVFRFDDHYDDHEEEYSELKNKILGNEEEESDEEDVSGRSESEASDDEAEGEGEGETEEKDLKGLAKNNNGTVKIRDMTNTEMLNLRKTVYLSIMATMSVDEICHKLLKIKVPENSRIEVAKMVVECCAQEKIYNKIYGAVGSRFCRMNMVLGDGKRWENLFEEAFENYYTTIQRYETSKLRNIATMFGYMLASDSLSWSVFECVKINEQDSNPSSRIFVKLLFQEMQQELGQKELAKRFEEDYVQPFLENMMPKDERRPEDTRFSINFFTALGLGLLTEGMREFLQNLPPPPSPSADSSRSRSGSRGISYSGSDYQRGRTRSRSYDSRSRSRSYDSRRRSRSSSRSYDRRSYDSRSRSRSRSYDSRSTSRDSRPRRSSRGRPYSRGRSVSNDTVDRSRIRSSDSYRGRPTSIDRRRSRSRSSERISRSRSRSYDGRHRSASPETHGDRQSRGIALDSNLPSRQEYSRDEIHSEDTTRRSNQGRYDSRGEVGSRNPSVERSPRPVSRRQANYHRDESHVESEAQERPASSRPRASDYI